MKIRQIAAYWDLRAEGYSKTIHEELSDETAAVFSDRLRRALPEGIGLSCLDIGCGPGFFSILLNRLGHNVTSADYSLEMLERARANCIEAGFEPHTIRVDAQALPFADGSFDFICSRNLVWNLEDPVKAYAEWARVLRPGGKMYIFDGNYYLHYYMSDYNKAREASMKEVNRFGAHSTHGVDPTPIDEIAKGLPLSSKLRPDWDAETLPGLGFKNIDIAVFTEDFTDPETNAKRSLIRCFSITCEKA